MEQLFLLICLILTAKPNNLLMATAFLGSNLLASDGGMREFLNGCSKWLNVITKNGSLGSHF
jgi:predicted membrane-bound mannosyltransferase